MGVSAVRPHIQNKFANPKKNAPVRAQNFPKNMMPMKANKFVKTWVPKTNDKAVITVSTANNISTDTTVNAAKQTSAPKILTKYSSHTIPNSIDPKNSKLKEFEYIDANGQLKTTSAWVPQKGEEDQKMLHL